MISSSLLDVAAFCSVGALSRAQHLAAAAAETMPTSDPEKVFAETLCLVATATARSASAPFGASSDQANALSQALIDLPLTLHAYVAGSEVLRTGAQSQESIPDYTPELARMLEFYQAHLPDGRLPDRKTLRNAMILWMGRISPRGLDEHPEARIDRLGLIDELNLHLRLSEAYARNVAHGAVTEPSGDAG